MIGIVLVTHGNLAKEFLSALEHVTGPQERIQAVCMAPDDDMSEKRNEIQAAVKNTDAGSGVIILTDMFGGTPSNLSISVTDGVKAEVLAGVNLPMLVKLASIRNQYELTECARLACEAGRKYLTAVSAFHSDALPKKSYKKPGV
jgi:mannose PTS system EIIA component